MVKVHDSTSESFLLSSSRLIKNNNPKIQVPHSIGWSAKALQINHLQRKIHVNNIHIKRKIIKII